MFDFRRTHKLATSGVYFEAKNFRRASRHNEGLRMNQELHQISYRVLTAVVTEEQKERTVRKALEGRGKSKFRRHFDQALSTIRLRGFRRGASGKAPVAVLERALRAIFPLKGGPLVFAVLQLWMEAEAILAADATEYLNNWGIPVHPLDAFPSGFSCYWPLSEARRHSLNFMEIYENHEPSDALLMLCLLSSRAPLEHDSPGFSLNKDFAHGDSSDDPANDDFESNSDECESSRNYWEDLLETIGCEAADAPLWDDVQSFVLGVTSLAATKLAARRDPRREALDELNKLRTSHFDHLVSYFNVTLPVDGALDPINGFEVFVVTVRQLSILLEEHRAVLATAYSSRQERLDRESKLSALEDAIVEGLRTFVAGSEPDKFCSPLSPLSCEAFPHLGGSATPRQTPADSSISSGSPSLFAHSEVLQLDASIAQAVIPVAIQPGALATAESAAFGSPPSSPSPLLSYEEAPFDIDGLVTPPEAPDDRSVSLGVNNSPTESRFLVARVQDAQAVVPPETPSEALANAQPDSASSSPVTEQLSVAAESNDQNLWCSLKGAFSSRCHLSLAYQFSLAGTGTCPSWLLKLLALGRGLLLADGLIAQELAKELGNLAENWNQETLAESNKLLLLAALLRPGLIAPWTGATSSLKNLGLNGSLSELAQLVADYGFRFNGIDDAKALFARTTGADLQDELRNLSQRARSFIEGAPYLTMVYAPATEVWRRWCGKSGWVNNLMTLVAEHSTDKADEVAKLIHRYPTTSELDRTIQETARAIRKGRLAPEIHTMAKEQLRKHAFDALKLGKDWLSQLQRSNSSPESEFGRLRAEVGRVRPRVQEQLRELLESPQRSQTCVSASVLLDAINDLEALLGGSPQADEQEPQFLLNLALLKTPVSLDDRWMPTVEEQLVRASLPALVECEIPWATAFELRLNQGEMGTAEAILNLMEDGNARRRDWTRALEDLRSQLIRDLAATRNNVDVASAHALLSEEERVSFESIIVDLQTSKEDIRAFKPAFARLGRIREHLERRREEHLVSLRARLGKVVADVSNSARRKIEDALEQQDLLVAEEYLHQAEQGHPIPLASDSDDVFLDFFTEGSKAIEVALNNERVGEIVRCLRTRSPLTIQGLEHYEMKGVSASRANETANMVEAWLESKRNNKSLIAGLTEAILTGLGFRGIQVRPEKNKPQSVIAHVEPISDRNLVPMSWFGSAAEGTYRIMGVWDRPEEEALFALVGDTQRQPKTIVLYFGRLTEARRRALAKLSKTRRRTFVVIDELLMFFLALEKRLRLDCLFRCAGPFTSFEPFLMRIPRQVDHRFHGCRSRFPRQADHRFHGKPITVSTGTRSEFPQEADQGLIAS